MILPEDAPRPGLALSQNRQKAKQPERRMSGKIKSETNSVKAKIITWADAIAVAFNPKNPRSERPQLSSCSFS